MTFLLPTTAAACGAIPPAATPIGDPTTARAQLAGLRGVTIFPDPLKKDPAVAALVLDGTWSFEVRREAGGRFSARRHGEDRAWHRISADLAEDGAFDAILGAVAASALRREGDRSAAAALA